MGRFSTYAQALRLFAIALTTVLALHVALQSVQAAPARRGECEHKACSSTEPDCGRALINHTCCWNNNSCQLISCILSECPDS